MTTQRTYPAGAAELWAHALPLSQSPEALAWCEDRGFHASMIESADAMRVAPLRVPQRWAWWPINSGYRLMFPLRDHEGVVRSIKFRTWLPKDQWVKNADGESLKSLLPKDGRVTGLMIAPAPLSGNGGILTIAEGETDVLALVCRGARQVLGHFSGGWSRAWATSVPAGIQTVLLCQDLDEAGDKYAQEIGETLPSGRFNIRRTKRVTGVSVSEGGDAIDLHDRLRAGSLPWDLVSDTAHYAVAFKPEETKPTYAQSTSSRIVNTTGITPYGAGALRRILEELEEKVGSNSYRNSDPFFAAIRAVYELVGGGEIPEVDARAALEDAQSKIRLKRSHAERAWKAREIGLAKPRSAPARDDEIPEAVKRKREERSLARAEDRKRKALDVEAQAREAERQAKAQAEREEQERQALEARKHRTGFGLPTAREHIQDGIDGVLGVDVEEGRVMVVQGVAGGSKTYHTGTKLGELLSSSVIEDLVDWDADPDEAEPIDLFGPNAGLKRALVVSPTRDLSRQTLDSWADRMDEIGVTQAQAVTRTRDNCERFDLITAANEPVAGSGRRVCRQCPLHPSRFDKDQETPCPFWHQLQAQEDANIVHMSHAMFLQSQGLGEGGLRFDWRTINDAAERGISVKPWVKRTDTGVTVTVVSQRPEEGGTSLAKPSYTDTRTWTGAAKHALYEWIVAHWKRTGVADVVPDDKLIRRQVQQLMKSDDKVFIRWSSIAAVSGNFARRYAPHIQRVGGLQQGLHLVVKPDPKGEPLPRVKYSPTMTRTSASKASFFNWLASRWDVAPHLGTLSAYAEGHVDARPYEVIVIDESMWGAARQTAALSPEHLLEMGAHGDLLDLSIEDDDDRQIPAAALLMLVASTRGKAKREERYVSSERLAELIDPSLLVIADETTNTSGELALQAALGIRDDAKAVEALKSAVPWRGVRGLANAINNCWQGAYIDDGKLYVAFVSAPRFDAARRGLVLDATSTEPTARALYGADIVYHKVDCDLPKSLKVTWVPGSTGSRSSAFGRGGPARKRQGAIWLSSLARWGAVEGALNFTHKRLLDDTDDWAHEALALLGEASITYHNSTESRGSNTWRDHHTVRIDAWHVPQAVIAQDAALLQQLTAWRGLCSECDWKAEAEHQLITALIEQELSRIRPREATDASPKHLVFVDERDPTQWGYPPDEVIDPDVLVWQELGVLTHIPQGLHPVAPLLVDAILEDCAGIYLPVVDRVAASSRHLSRFVPAPNGRNRWARRLWQAKEQGCQEPYNDLADLVATCLRSWVKHHFRGDWRAFAAAVGCGVTWVRWGAGKPSPVLCRSTDDIDQVRLEDWMDVVKATSYRLDGGEWQQMPEVYSGLELALVKVGDGKARGFDTRQWTAALAAAAEVNERTIRNWVSKVKVGGERGVVLLTRLYHKVHARLRFDWLQRWLAKREGDAMHHTMVAALKAWEETGVVLPGPGDIDSWAATIEARGGPPPPELPAAA